MSNAGARRVSLHALIICSTGKKHRRQRRITASADGTRAALSRTRNLGLSAVGQLGKQARWSVRKKRSDLLPLLASGPSRTHQFCPAICPVCPAKLDTCRNLRRTNGPTDGRFGTCETSRRDPVKSAYEVK